MVAKQQEPLEFTSVTPSGIEVLFQAEPKRLYKVRQPAPFGQSGVPDFTDWREVPSVTTVLDVLDKPGLPWWGMEKGIEGTIKLHNLGLLESMQSGHQKVLAQWNPAEMQYEKVDTAQVVSLLTRHQLTVNHVRDEAGDRGTGVHKALEHWADTGVMPDPTTHPPQEQGYVYGLSAFLEHAMLEPVAQEIMVGSVEHGFAGRYDLRARTTQECMVVKHRTPKRGPQWATLPADLNILIDLKTSKDVYDKHIRQLEAYEQASIEDGYEPTDARGVLLVGPDGTYKFVRSWATFEDFRVVLDVWRSNERMKEAKKHG